SQDAPQRVVAPTTRRADEGPRPELLAGPPAVIAAGVDLLTDALRAQAVDVTPVDFRPPVDTPAGTADALATVLADPRRADATASATQRMLAVRATRVDVLPASEALGMQPGEFYRAGPPITWERASGPLRGALIGAMLFEGLADSPDEA